MQTAIENAMRESRAFRAALDCDKGLPELLAALDARYLLQQAALVGIEAATTSNDSKRRYLAQRGGWALQTAILKLALEARLGHNARSEMMLSWIEGWHELLEAGYCDEQAFESLYWWVAP